MLLADQEAMCRQAATETAGQGSWSDSFWDVNAYRGALINASQNWFGPHLVDPDGDPAAIRESAQSYYGHPDAVEAFADSIDDQVGVIRDAADADFGDALVDGILLISGYVRTYTKPGLWAVPNPLETYAGALERNRVKLEANRAYLRTLHGMLAGIPVLTLFTPYPEWDATRQNLNQIRNQAAQALEDAAAIFAHQGRLRDDVARALAQSRSQAALSQAPVFAGPTGISALTALETLAFTQSDDLRLSPEQWQAYIDFRGTLTEEALAEFDALLLTLSAADRLRLFTMLATGAPLDLSLQLLALPELTDHDGYQGSFAFPVPPGVDPAIAALISIAVNRDPFVEHFLLTGERIGGFTPDFLSGYDLSALEDPNLDWTDRAEMLAVILQEEDGLNLPLLPPNVPPEYVAEEFAEILGTDVIEYSSLDDGYDAGTATAAAVESVERGDPVIFLVGDEELGAPNAYLVLVRHENDLLYFFDPASGETIAVPAGSLEDNGIGGYDTVYGVIAGEQ